MARSRDAEDIVPKSLYAIGKLLHLSGLCND
jgi:hypothetical protein